MARTKGDARRWMQEGTSLLVDAAASMESLAAPSLLPGWSRAVLLSHVAANADAIGNLVHWAATGEETPMYASPEARADDIERGSRLDRDQLLARVRRSAEQLEAAMAGLTDAQWSSEVMTAHGRTVPATETPWMRAREVMVHAVDLDGPVGFADLPDDFLAALVDDILAKRELSSRDLPAGPVSEVAAWLAGRPHGLADAPVLGPWL